MWGPDHAPGFLNRKAITTPHCTKRRLSAAELSSLRTPGQRLAKATRPPCLFFSVWGPQRGKEPQEVTTLGKHRAYCVSGMCTKAFNSPNNPTRYSVPCFTDRAGEAQCGQVAGPRPCDH